MSMAQCPRCNPYPLTIQQGIAISKACLEIELTIDRIGEPLNKHPIFHQFTKTFHQVGIGKTFCQQTIPYHTIYNALKETRDAILKNYPNGGFVIALDKVKTAIKAMETIPYHMRTKQ